MSSQETPNSMGMWSAQLDGAERIRKGSMLAMMGCLNQDLIKPEVQPEGKLPKKSPIEQLPMELLSHMTCYLLPSFTLQLAFASKTLYQRLGDKQGEIERQKRVYISSMGKKLRQYLSHKGFVGGIQLCKHYSLPFELVQAITEKAQDKPSLDHLSHECTLSDATEVEVALKLVGNRLFLRLQYDMEVDSAEGFMAKLEEVKSWGCHHSMKTVFLGFFGPDREAVLRDLSLSTSCHFCNSQCRGSRRNPISKFHITVWKDFRAPKCPNSTPWSLHQTYPDNERGVQCELNANPSAALWGPRAEGTIDLWKQWDGDSASVAMRNSLCRVD
ncbi:hypothetical protein MMC28_003197 [Mycoblastus sanguinarius]|nr:hypothetical protein [Mycoblastus sanguinarius]